jgi:hypothetical protein
VAEVIRMSKEVVEAVLSTLVTLLTAVGDSSKMSKESP